MLTKFIHFPTFLISLALGLFFIYISDIHSRKIFVYPTPENTNDIQYVDYTNNCFQFKHEEIDCNDNNIMSIPIQAS